MTLSQAKSLFQDLNFLVTNNSNNDVQIQSLLKQIKLLISNFQIFNANETSTNVDELIFARDFNELNVIHYLKTRSVSDYEPTMKRLRTIYADCQNLKIDCSNRNLLNAVFLIYLLSNNRIKEFHSVLESNNIQDFDDVHISFVLKIEQALTLGNYKEVLGSKNSSTHEYFNVFLERVLETIRFEISRSAEKSYHSLKFGDLAEIFQLESEQEVINYIKNQEIAAEENGFKWRIANKVIYFEKFDQGGKHINADELMRITLQYSQEIERII